MLTPLWQDTATPWSPWRELRLMQRDLDRLFEQRAATTVPAYNVDETEKEFLVTVDVPGIAPADINVELKDGRLQVSAESKQGNRERKFNVAFALPTDIDEEKLEAKVEHGVLVLALPKSAKPEARKIPVKAAV